MTFYFVSPKEKTSYSRRWYVDDAGLKKVQHMYENYNKDPNNIVNRWNDFEVKPIKAIFIDFGGMCWTKEPIIKFTCMKTKFEVPITHLPYFQDVLASELKVKDGLWSTGIWLFGHVYSNETRLKLWKKVKAVVMKTREQRKQMDEQMDADIKAINDKDGAIKVLRVKRKHHEINN